MIITITYLEELINKKVYKTMQIHDSSYSFKYKVDSFIDDTSIILNIDLEHSIVDDNNGNVIGHFGIDPSNKILVYYLKKIEGAIEMPTKKIVTNKSLEIEQKLGYMNIYLELLFEALKSNNQEEINAYKEELELIRIALTKLGYFITK